MSAATGPGPRPGGLGLSPRARRGGVRRHFAALYAGLFLASGALMLVVVALVAHGARIAAPGPGTAASGAAFPAQAQERISSLEHQLADAQAAQSRQLLLGGAAGFGVMGLLSVGLGWYAAGRVLRPVRAMTAATRRISADNLHERLAVPGPEDELKGLGDTIDALLARLERAFGAQRRFVADASHELRTPLATIGVAVDVALAKPDPVPEPTRALAARVRTELDRVEGLLEGLLALARLDHADLPDIAPVRLDELAGAALAERQQAISAGGLTVTNPAPGPVPPLRGSAPLLQRLVGNLVENAVVHNEPGGWLRMEVTAGGGSVRLLVENGGPLLMPDQVALLTRPFRRLGATPVPQQGLGLGLGIVAAVAEAHGGGLALAARPDGGLRAEVTLPLAPAEETA